MEVIYSIGTKFAGGGIGDIAYYAVSGIYRHNYLKKLLCLDYKKTEIDEAKIKKINSIYYTSFLLYGAKKLLGENFNPFWYIDRWYDYLASYQIDKCDIFHGWNNHSLQSLRKARKQGAKTVIERASSHPLIQDRLLREEYQKYGIKKKANPFLERSCKELNECDYVMIPSDFVRSSFIEQGFDEEKLIQIPFGVDTEKFKLREKEEGIFRVLFVGQIKLRKGFQYLLEAWKELDLKDTELILVGGVSEEAKGIVEDYKKKLDFKMPGFVQDIVKTYQNSSIFVFPSIEDGFGLVILEAMACGLPVILSENTGAKDVVREGKDGFIVPIRDVEKIKEKIRYFYDNPEEIKRMGNNARERVESYTWKRYQKSLMKQLESIL